MVERPVTIIKDFEAIKDRMAILNPYSNSAFEADFELFEKSSKFMTEKEFLCYTNVIKEQRSIEETQELRCTIRQLYDIACGIPYIISIRSGILDFLAPSNINMFALYENCSERLEDMYHVTSWNCKGKIEELYMRNADDARNAINRLGAFVKESVFGRQGD